VLKAPRSVGKQLGDVASSPFRYKCLALLCEGTRSPADLAQELGVPVEKLTYHVKALHEAGAIELVGVVPGNRSVKHLYRAAQRAEVDDETFARLSVDDRITAGRTVSQLNIADVAQSMEARTFGERPDHHISRFPLTLDEEGWKEMREIHARALEETYEVTARVASRNAGDPGRETIQARSAMFFFEMPPKVRGNGGT
jgi:DNA-binding Lrp family transcriptional regulator